MLNRAVTEPVSVELRTRISELCDRLFHSIGLQTSVQKYFAIGEERGAVLDFVDYPLNNRWWLEDQFKAIRALKSEDEKNRRLLQLATWEHPGPGSFYDDVGKHCEVAARGALLSGVWTRTERTSTANLLVVGPGKEPRPPQLAGDPVAGRYGL